MRNAFTVLELVVALTIIGVLAAVTIPRISDINRQNKVQRAANVLQLEVQQAYTLAARNQRPIKVVWRSDSMQVRVTDRSEVTTYRKTGFGAKSTFGFAATDVTFYPTTLTVFPNGLASDTLFMKVAQKTFSKTVRFTRAGIVRVQ